MQENWALHLLLQGLSLSCLLAGLTEGKHGPGGRQPHSQCCRGVGRQNAWRRGMAGREGGHIPLGCPAKSTPEFHYVIALQLTSHYGSSQKAWTFEPKSKGQFLPLNQGGRGNIWSMVDPSSVSWFIRNQELIFWEQLSLHLFSLYLGSVRYRLKKNKTKNPKPNPKNPQHKIPSKPLYTGFYLGTWYSEYFLLQRSF